MKKTALFIFFLFATLTFGQIYVVDSFDVPLAPDDSTYWIPVHSDNADTSISYIDISYQNAIVQKGDNALRLDYAVHNIESWGGFYKLEHWSDSTSYFDFSSFEELSIWYYIAEPQTLEGRVHLRIQFYDASDAASGTKMRNANEGELYYSFHYVLDSIPGWHQIVMPMKRTDTYDNAGFTLTGWSGITGNGILDLDKIGGYGFEFSIDGAGEGDVSEGSIVFDAFELQGLAPKSLVYFNGLVVPGGVNLTNGGWNDHAFEITDEETFDPNTTSIKWTTSAWALYGGANFVQTEIKNMEYHWSIDTCKFNIKAPAGTGNLKLIFLDDDTDSTGEDLEFEAGYLLEASTMGYDGTWKTVEIPLRNFNRFDGGWNGSSTSPGEMDSSRVKQFRIITMDENSFGKVIYLDNIWTGSPVFDNVAPAPVEGLLASAGSYVNIVTWLDVPGEDDESYDIYYDEEPITDVTKWGVDVVKMGVEGGIQAVEHVLIAPKTNQDVTYYYAIVCNDAAGNKSELTQSTALTNEARGVAIIHPTAPASFSADGNLSEWTGIDPFRMYPSDGSGTVVTNTTIDGDDDCSADAYLAMDDNYLYVAFNVNDDVVSSDTTFASYLIDAPDVFIGLYNWHGASHTSYQRGSEPDYHFRFNSNKMIIDNLSSVTVQYSGTPDYSFVEKFPSGYAVEARIPFTKLADLGGDLVFTPLVGKRIPVDFSINDNDTPGTDQRDGILTYSPNNQDQSYQDVSRWSHTWIGEEWVSGVSEDLNNSGVPSEYEVSQNYPNPFNPTTQISYGLKENTFVTLKIYNILGEEVAVLVNQEQNAGRYIATFNASQLASGIYIYQLNAGNFTSSKKMMLVK